MIQKLLSVGLILAGCLCASASAAPIFVSFSGPGTSASASATETFNVFANSSSASVPLDLALPLNDSTGAATGVTIMKPEGLFYGGSTNAGTTAVSGDAAAAGITQSAAGSYHYSNGNDVRTYTFTGFNPALTYDFSIFGSRNAGDERNTQYTLDNGTTSQSQNQLVAGPVNNSELNVFSGVAPSSSGAIDLSFQYNPIGGNNAFGYINAVRIDTNQVPEPTALALFGFGGTCLLIARKRRS